MRGNTDPQDIMFHSFSMRALVPADHPLRAIKKLVDEELSKMSPAFSAAYSRTGRPSIPPEQLLKAMMLQALYSIRSERQLCEQIGYNFLYRWFLNLQPEDPVFDHTTFSHNRDRFHQHGFTEKFFNGSVMAAIRQQAIGDENFTVDGTLIEAWASMKSVRPKGEDSGDSNSWDDWHGQSRTNETHQSRTDPEARLMRKSDGKESKLSHTLHVLMENKNGFLMNLRMDEANGHAERDSAADMCKQLNRKFGCKPRTIGADKGYDDGEFLWRMKHMNFTPHVAIREGNIKDTGWKGDQRRECRERMQTQEYLASQRRRKRIEAIFGWLKTIAGLDRTPYVGRWKTQMYAFVAGGILNLLKLVNLERRLAM